LKKICVLGATGSIGRQTLDIVRSNPDSFKVVALSTHQNTGLLAEQVKEFKPDSVVVTDKNRAQEFDQQTNGSIPVLSGTENLVKLVERDDVDIVINALVGSVGLKSTLATIRAKKILGLANKESMVVGGELVREELKKNKGSVIPVDSEHSAIFQCLYGENPGDLKRIILTGSGGPFRGRKAGELRNVTPEEALAHPRWNMGKKISVDSATLMNKGLEVIEAHFLFNLEYDQIDVVIHPQSIIHSMVEFIDGSIKAHLGQTDMKIPIQYALSFPERLRSSLPSIDFVKLGSLTFESPDSVNFPCLKYSFEAGRKRKTYPAVLNAVNEEVVAAFLGRRIPFTAIPEIIVAVLDAHNPCEAGDLGILEESEIWAREKAGKLIENY